MSLLIVHRQVSDFQSREGFSAVDCVMSGADIDRGSGGADNGVVVIVYSEVDKSGRGKRGTRSFFSPLCVCSNTDSRIC
jgi:hypothetical protein